MWRLCGIPPPTADGLACSPVCFLVNNFPSPWPKSKKTFLSFGKRRKVFLDLGQGEGKLFTKKQTGEQANPSAVGGGIPHSRHIGHEEKWDGEKAQEDGF